MHSVAPLRRARVGVIPRTVTIAAVALAMAGLLVSWSPERASGWNQGAAEATLWQLLNGARANNGVGPLQQHSGLVGLARWRSQDMIKRDYFSHTILGSGCDVYCWYDSNGIAYVWAGENIGWNSGLSDAQSPVSVHEGFMASPGHRANALDPAFTHGGVGAYGADNVRYQGYTHNVRMYTELFLQAPGAAAPPPPPPPPPPAAAPPPPPPPPPAAVPPPAAPAPAPAPAAVTAPAPTPAPEPVKVVAEAAPQPDAGEEMDGIHELLTPTGRDAAQWLAHDDGLGVPSGLAELAASDAIGAARVQAAWRVQEALLAFLYELLRHFLAA